MLTHATPSQTPELMSPNRKYKGKAPQTDEIPEVSVRVIGREVREANGAAGGVSALVLHEVLGSLGRSSTLTNWMIFWTRSFNLDEPYLSCGVSVSSRWNFAKRSYSTESNEVLGNIM